MNRAENPKSVEVREDGTVIKTFSDRVSITPSEPFGASMYRLRPDFWRRQSQAMADILEEAAIKLGIFTADDLHHILSLRFISEVA